MKESREGSESSMNWTLVLTMECTGNALVTSRHDHWYYRYASFGVTIYLYHPLRQSNIGRILQENVKTRFCMDRSTL
jgi:hypothetical protein